MNKSIWNSLKMENFSNALPKRVDILIVGAGLTGVVTSYLLKDSNKSVFLIDKGKVGRGVTCNSTAKVSFLQRDLYQKIYKNYNLEKTKLYLESQIDGTNMLVDICKKENINCDLKKVKSYLFANTKQGIDKLNKEKDILEKLNISCKIDSLPINFLSKESFYVEDTYTFHPLKFINGILKIIKDKVSIIEDTTVIEVKKKDDSYLVITNKGEILCKKVVVASHYPFFIFPSLIPFKNHIEREYVNVAKIKSRENFCAINTDKDLKSMMYYGDYLLYVSNNHRIMDDIDYQKNYEKSRKEFKRYFKKEALYTWANQDLFTTDNLPLIGYAADNNKNLLIATGYNGWGITNSFIAAKILTDLILEKSNKYIDLFSINRFSLPMLKNSIIDSLYYVKAYIESAFHNDSKIYIKEINGIKYNVYQDDKGTEHIVKRKCPHLKCDLIFNHEDLTWDCPCHGSRFDIDGNLVEGPAKYDIRKE